jgi:1-acyl-sn-glycerol-3-phosphate acyltransferase
MDRVFKVTIGAGRLAFRALDVRLHVAGTEHLPAEGPVLLASNHVSYPDFLFVGSAALERGRYTRFLARHDVWHVPVVRRAMEAMRHVPVDREVPAAAYLRARRLQREGEAVCAFPEAGISWSYTVRPLMRGVASLARETGVPVVPVTTWGGHRIWTVVRSDDGHKSRPDLTRGRRVDVRFGEPFRVGPEDDLVEATCRLGHALTAGLEELQALPEHRPPEGSHAPWHPLHLGGHARSRAAAREPDNLPRSAVPATWGPCEEDA